MDEGPCGISQLNYPALYSKAVSTQPVTSLHSIPHQINYKPISGYLHHCIPYSKTNHNLFIKTHFVSPQYNPNVTLNPSSLATSPLHEFPAHTTSHFSNTTTKTASFQPFLQSVQFPSPNFFSTVPSQNPQTFKSVAFPKSVLSINLDTKTYFIPNEKNEGKECDVNALTHHIKQSIQKTTHCFNELQTVNHLLVSDESLRRVILLQLPQLCCILDLFTNNKTLYGTSHTIPDSLRYSVVHEDSSQLLTLLQVLPEYITTRIQLAKALDCFSKSPSPIDTPESQETDSSKRQTEAFQSTANSSRTTLCFSDDTVLVCKDNIFCLKNNENEDDSDSLTHRHTYFKESEKPHRIPRLYGLKELGGKKNSKDDIYTEYSPRFNQTLSSSYVDSDITTPRESVNNIPVFTSVKKGKPPCVPKLHNIHLLKHS